jgi:hypothetical protein
MTGESAAAVLSEKERVIILETDADWVWPDIAIGGHRAGEGLHD